MPPRDINVFGASEHNLKNIDVSIPRNSLTVVTGLSGSGKSSLAFDTIYAEGQRRYVESLSAYARQFLDQIPKPHVEHIEGLSPAISIEQKTVSRNPRSTVGTVTEIYDYMRLLWATVGDASCPHCGSVLQKQTAEEIADQVMALPEGTRLFVLAPVVRGRKGEYQALFQQALRDGIVRAKIDGEVRELDPEMRLRRQYKHDISLVMDRFIVRGELRSRLLDSVRKALRKAEGLVIIETVPNGEGQYPKGVAWEGERVFSEALSCPTHGPQIVELAPRMFSFNSPFGACPKCQGLGTVPVVDMDAIIPDPSLSINDGAVVPWRSVFSEERESEPNWSWTFQLITSVAKKHKFKLSTPWNKLSKKAHEILLEGTGKEEYPVPLTSRAGETTVYKGKWEGLIARIYRRLKEEDDESRRAEYLQYLSDATCPACNGDRLKPETLAVKIADSSIADVNRMSVEDAAAFFARLDYTGRKAEIAEQPLHEIRERLSFLLNVGLDYLSLDRTAGTLSGGEAQRIRLATQIGSKLRGVLYVLDEPSIGLHQRDNERLIQTLLHLRDMGNTVLVVEHDEQTIRLSDHVVDLGPGAGALGGKVIASCPPDKLASVKDSSTADYISGRKTIAVPDERRPRDPQRCIEIKGARHNNLRGIDIELPLGVMTGITGVSGSGKSSFVIDTLVPALGNVLHRTNHQVGEHDAILGLDHLDKIIAVDQTPIGRTPRSNPATYTKVFDLIRDLFAQTPEARMRGYAKGRFSFNVKGGRCEDCKGDGLRRIEMHFLPDVFVECETCQGRRYNRETLEVEYRGKNIADVLDMTIEEALDFFEAVPMIANKLRTLHDVGLGYITLGQQATTLSGGEAQRIKLSRELSKRNTGRTLYVLDEPTTGLHFEDVHKLIEVCNRLVDAGSTVLIIEHNLDVIKSCDWLIDLGPGGGQHGGLIVAAGPPEEVAASPDSETGRFLAEVLGVKRRESKPISKAVSTKAAKKASKKAAKKASPKKSSKKAAKSRDGKRG